jgi:hypothetical protein
MLCYTLGVGREVKSASIDRTQVALKHGVPLQLSDRPAVCAVPVGSIAPKVYNDRWKSVALYGNLW